MRNARQGYREGGPASTTMRDASPSYNAGMRIGVLLTGCGSLDGSDPEEILLLLLALEEAGERPVLLAPDRPQERVIDHRTALADEANPRSVLVEAARLTRQPVRDLREVAPEEIEALFVPGGYGAALNLQGGFARPGEPRTLHPEVERFLRHFAAQRKPIGTIGLGDVPVRALFGLELPDDPSGRTGGVEADAERRLWHTPGRGASGRLQDLRAGIAALVAAVLDALRRDDPGTAAARRAS
jgi:enhancing lycopene biosynthesis protein 2